MTSATAPTPAVGEPAPREVLARVQEVANYFVPLTLRAVAGLGVADLLARGPRTIAELAAETNTHEQSLYRALRALAGSGIFTEIEPRRFALTPAAQLLRSDHPLSVRDAYPLLAADVEAWAHVDHSLRTGESAFAHVHGRPYYDFLAEDHAAAERFDRSVRAQSRLVLRTLSSYDWSRLGTVVDVGAGDGTFLAGLLRRYRSLRGVVFDLPHVVRGTPDVLEAAGVADRCEVVAGSFFDGVPTGADTYLLKTILHDWDDESAGRILRAVRAAMRPDSLLVVLEALLPPGDEYHVGKLLDLHSLVLVAGPDRDENGYAALLAAAGLRLERVTPTSTLAIMDVRRA
jgi:hypothetical protein